MPPAGILDGNLSDVEVSKQCRYNLLHWAFVGLGVCVRHPEDASAPEGKVAPERKREALKVRKAIERKFGEAKKWHGLGRARHRTRAKVAIQAFLVFRR